jgi:hypothetical protein
VEIDTFAKKVVISHEFNTSSSFVPTEYEQDYIDLRKGSIKTSLVFDFENEKVYFRLVDNYGGEIKCINLDGGDKPLRNYKMREQINGDIRIRKILQEALSQLYEGNAFPFSVEELDLNKMILLMKYRGYPKGFYDGIPWGKFSRGIEGSFEEISHELSSRKYTELKEFYLQYGLPNKKAIRRIIFNSPALFFYSEEMKLVPFTNIDILQQLLSSKEAFHFLSKIHSFPGIVNYIADMIAERGEVSTWQHIKKNWNRFEKEAGMYSISSPANKKLIAQGKEIEIRDSLSGIIVPYSLPVINNEQCSVSDVHVVEGYEFTSLKNTNDFDRAGKELNNCLGDSFDGDGRIFVAKESGKYVAAIQVYEDVIYQALLAKNESIENNISFQAAFYKWVEKHNLIINFENN